MLTRLRRIASCFFFTLAVLSATLWVRSWFYFDSVEHEPKLDPNRLVGIEFRSGQGIAVYEHHTPPTEAETVEMRWRRVSRLLHPPLDRTFFLTFDWEAWAQPLGDGHLRITIPHWLPILIFSLLAVAVRPKPRFKFSLRDLLTLTTVAALVIGPLAFWLRSIG